MTLNLKEIVEIYSDMLRPCPNCQSQTLIVEERISRVNLFNLDSHQLNGNYSFPSIFFEFRCAHCQTTIYSKTKSIKDEKNYFELLSSLFREIDHIKTKARLNNTRQTTIKESVNHENR